MSWQTVTLILGLAGYFTIILIVLTWRGAYDQYGSNVSRRDAAESQKESSRTNSEPSV